MADTITIPRAEYQRLVEAAQVLEDIRVYDQIVAELDAGREELVPAVFADRLVAGESPVRVYRSGAVFRRRNWPDAPASTGSSCSISRLAVPVARWRPCASSPKGWG